jgi:flagellin
MSFSVVTNIASANAQANLQVARGGLDKAMQRLSSGYRINMSGDDSAGLAVANKYRNEQAILNQGIRNANDGLSKLQLKDGALANISTLLDRMATLSTQASNGASDADISKLSAEYASIVTEINREATVAGLTTAVSDSGFSVFVSSESTSTNGIVSGSIGAAKVADLAISMLTFTTVASAQTALSEVKAAITNLGSVQNTVGTLQNRLQFAVSLAQSQSVNKLSAEGRIRDANMAEESAAMTKFNILNQSGIAALAQANQSSSAILALLR